MNTNNNEWQRYALYGEEFVRRLFKLANTDRDEFYSGDYPVEQQSPGEWISFYLNKEKRAAINTAVWRGEFPVVKDQKEYLTPAQALGKIVYDVVFYYRDDWEVVREVASRSPYTEF